jgi:hypothetical protein
MTDETRLQIESMLKEYTARVLLVGSPANGNVLDQVGTVSEVAERWGRNRKTVEMAIWNDQLQARQSGSIWLIDLSSVRRRWGDGESTRLKRAA